MVAEHDLRVVVTVGVSGDEGAVVLTVTDDFVDSDVCVIGLIGSSLIVSSVSLEIVVVSLSSRSSSLCVCSGGIVVDHCRGEMSLSD